MCIRTMNKYMILYDGIVYALYYIMKKLPKKLSDRILLALHDLELVENDPRYIVDMDRWHINNNGFCEVCLAGAVMAKSLNFDINRTIDPSHLDEDLNSKLMELNHVRHGHITELYDKKQLMYNNYDEDLGYLSQHDRPQLKTYMLDIVGILQAEGL